MGGPSGQGKSGVGLMCVLRGCEHFTPWDPGCPPHQHRWELGCPTAGPDLWDAQRWGMGRRDWSREEAQTPEHP